MRYEVKRLASFWAALAVMFIMALAASRQLFLFAVFRDARGVLDPRGGEYHLWLAAGAALAACVAGGLMFFFFVRGQGGSSARHFSVSSTK